MRFPLVARRIILAPVLGLALAVAVAACSSSSSSSSSSRPVVRARVLGARVVGAVRGRRPRRRGLHGQLARRRRSPRTGRSSSPPAPRSRSGSPCCRTGTRSPGPSAPYQPGERARRQGHRRDGELRHLGHRDLQPHGRRNVAAAGQTGTAVYQNGVWKVGDASLCGLLKLVPGGSVPAACSSAG